MSEAHLIIKRDDGSGKKINIKDSMTGSGPKAGIRVESAPKTSNPYAPSQPKHGRVDVTSNRIPVESFNDFLNPKKRLEEQPEHEEEQSVGMSGDFDDDMGGDDGFGDDEEQGGGYEDAYEKPSMGFNTIEEEKRDIILKLYRLKTKGFPVTKSFTMQGDINEMRTELEKVKYGIDVEASIKFQRKILLAIVNTLEFANNRWDPFDLALNGWSESVYDSLGDYDNVFERLWAKYKNKASLPPELELLLTLGGSAFMFHITQSMLKTMPAVGEVIRNNPNLMEQVMNAMAGASNKATTETDKTTYQSTPPQQSGGGYEMKGPPMDIGKLTGMFGPMNPPKPPQHINMIPQSSTPNEPKFVPKPPPSLQDDMMSIMSDMDSIPESTFSENIKNIVLDGSKMKTKKGKGKNATSKNILNLV